VLAEIAANGFHKTRQLPLVTSVFGYQMGHLATWFLLPEVGVLEFCVADVCAKYREKYRDEGFLDVF
jgi:hypothetical protein